MDLDSVMANHLVRDGPFGVMIVQQRHTSDIIV
jgi:hypothetical protein